MESISCKKLGDVKEALDKFTDDCYWYGDEDGDIIITDSSQRHTIAIIVLDTSEEDPTQE